MFLTSHLSKYFNVFRLCNSPWIMDTNHLTGRNVTFFGCSFQLIFIFYYFFITNICCVEECIGHTFH